MNPISIVSAYAIIVFTLYLFGYWSSFDINVLEYASLQDVLKLAIYPLSIAAISSLTFIIVQTVFSLNEIKKGELDKVFMLIPRRYANWVIAISGILVVVLLNLIMDEGLKWRLIGTLVLVTLVLSIDDIRMLSPHIPNPVVRRLTIVVGLIIITGSFGHGKRNAKLILSGQRAKIVSTEVFRDQGTDLLKSKELLKGHETLKYLGVVGDYFFFISMDNKATYVVKYSDLHFLEFTNLGP